MSKRGIRMNAVALTEAVGDRVAQWLRLQWPQHTVKKASAALDADERTVKAWLNGAMPINRHLWQMVAHFGRPFLDWISMPALTPDEEQALDDRLETLEAEIRRLRSDLSSTARRSRQTEVAALYVARRGEHEEGETLAPQVPAAHERG